MEPIYQTGNPTVDRLSRIRLTGNVIPPAWYHTILRETGKPYLIAIVILSDIVYWYRAAEVRDEGSGQLLGYRKRFKADLLQRSYQQMADQFGITKRDATNAIVELEKLGVIRRVFRTLTINGQSIPNVLFIELDVDILERLTFPEDYAEEVESVKRVQKKSQKKAQGTLTIGYPQFKGDVSPKSEEGLSDWNGASISKKARSVSELGETNTEITYKDYNNEYPIYSYLKVKEEFKNQIEYEILRRDLKELEELEELVEVAVEILVSSADTIRVNREDKPAELVKEQYRRLNMFHIQYVLTCLRETETKARNIRAVMVTALYNSVNTIGTYYGNLVKYHQKIKYKEGTE